MSLAAHPEGNNLDSTTVLTKEWSHVQGEPRTDRISLIYRKLERDDLFHAFYLKGENKFPHTAKVKQSPLALRTT